MKSKASTKPGEIWAVPGFSRNREVLSKDVLFSLFLCCFLALGTFGT